MTVYWRALPAMTLAALLCQNTSPVGDVNVNSCQASCEVTVWESSVFCGNECPVTLLGRGILVCEVTAQYTGCRFTFLMTT